MRSTKISDFFKKRKTQEQESSSPQRGDEEFNDNLLSLRDDKKDDRNFHIDILLPPNETIIDIDSDDCEGRHDDCMSPQKRKKQLTSLLGGVHQRRNGQAAAAGDDRVNDGDAKRDQNGWSLGDEASETLLRGGGGGNSNENQPLEGEGGAFPVVADDLAASDLVAEDLVATDTLIAAETLLPSSSSVSLTSMLMSRQAEENQWAEASALEDRNKEGRVPLSERKCPFYKFVSKEVTVDAFRYGKIENCSAYFLSHFHADHYGGLSASWSHGPIYCGKITANLVRVVLNVNPTFVKELPFNEEIQIPTEMGEEEVFVTLIDANHCPGAAIFLFKIRNKKNIKALTHEIKKMKTDGTRGDKNLIKKERNGDTEIADREDPENNDFYKRVLHCGDFRACSSHWKHPLLLEAPIDVCYLDTTYLSPKYAFPSQISVLEACAAVCVNLQKGVPFHVTGIERFFRKGRDNEKEVNQKNCFPSAEKLDECLDEQKGLEEVSFTPLNDEGRLLVVIGTYSIGKEKMCLSIAEALNCMIFATERKRMICEALEDEKLNIRITDDPWKAQVHMQPLMDLRLETLRDYFDSLEKVRPGHFSRIVGFRPSGWTYKSPKERIIHPTLIDIGDAIKKWKSPFQVDSLEPMRGSGYKVTGFLVPYSEHSSFRELLIFGSALPINKFIPTVNVQSRESRIKMMSWLDKIIAFRKRCPNQLFDARELR